MLEYVSPKNKNTLKKFLDLFVVILYVFYTTCMFDTIEFRGGHQSAWMVVSCHVGARKQMQVLLC